MRSASTMKPAAFRKLQAKLAWTNQKIADRLHVSLSTIEKWRAGTVPIPPTASALLLAIAPTELRAARG